MGLFSNNKKLCPICGEPTPRLFPTKVEDMPICKECADKVDLPSGALDNMSFADFEQYIAYFDGNQALRNIFTEDYRYSFGFFSNDILLDTHNRLFSIRPYEASFVMEASNLKAFRIMEDNAPLFESANGILKCYKSDVPKRINEMAPLISQYMMQRKQYEMAEQMERMAEQIRESTGRDEPNSSIHHSRPNIEVPVPFQHFRVELKFEHPYWEEISMEQDGPSMNQNDPRIGDYLRDYEEMVDKLHTLAWNLIQLMYPGATEDYQNGRNEAMTGSTQTAPIVQTAPAVDAVEEIKKYKGLLDAGIITEDEFAAKKRQLLGI